MQDKQYEEAEEFLLDSLELVTLVKFREIMVILLLI